jgi:hypothetical protein
MLLQLKSTSLLICFLALAHINQDSTKVAKDTVILKSVQPKKSNMYKMYELENKQMNNNRKLDELLKRYE